MQTFLISVEVKLRELEKKCGVERKVVVQTADELECDPFDPASYTICCSNPVVRRERFLIVRTLACMDIP